MGSMTKGRWLWLVGVGAAAFGAFGAEPDEEWKAAAEKMKVSPAVVAALEKDGAAWGTNLLKQVFVPYVDGPRFLITADAVLGGFGVMLEETVRRLECGEAEEKAMRRFCKDLARLMFYGGNSYFAPQDDAPKIVDIGHNPNTGEVFRVAAGRPREVWVLYPWHGKRLLLRGAALSYYEFGGPARLTDAQWRERLDGPEAPEPPDWLPPGP